MKLTVPTKIRVAIYVVLGILGTTITAVYTYNAQLGHLPPAWFIGGSAAYIAVTQSAFVLSLLNISKDDVAIQVSRPDPADFVVSEAAEAEVDEEEDDEDAGVDVVLSPATSDTL